MKKILIAVLVVLVAVTMLYGISYAGSSKTWSGIGKGLAIYEGVKVLTGRQGNIIDDVTGGMQPRESSSSSGSYEDGYNAGYKSGYQEGYNAGFRHGTEKSGN